MKESKNGRRTVRAGTINDSYSVNRPGWSGASPVPSRAGIRAENRRRRRRRILLIFYILLFLAVMSAAAVISLTVLFKIDTIEVSGASRYSQDQIVGACGIQKGENLFLAGTKRAEQQVQARLPYIGSVKIKRKLPAKISIEVSAATVCGAVAYGDKYAVLSDQYRVLEITDKPSQNCPPIKGITLKSAKVGDTAVFEDESLLTSLQKVEEAIRKNKMEHITGMDLSSASKILVHYDGRVTLNLGLSSGLDYKFSFAKKLLESGQIKDTEKGVLNLSTVEENDTAYFDPVTDS